VGECGLDASASGQGPVAGFCEHGNEPSDPVEGREFLDYLSGYRFSRRILLHVVTYLLGYGQASLEFYYRVTEC
jgi:hypothetical protein